MGNKLANLQNELNAATRPAPRPQTAPAILPRATQPAMNSREGKRNIAAWLPKEFMQSIRLVQAKRADDEPSLQELMAEALNDLFAKHNIPTVSE